MHARSVIRGYEKSRVQYTSTKGSVSSCGPITAAVCQRDKRASRLHKHAKFFPSIDTIKRVCYHCAPFYAVPNGVHLVTSLSPYHGTHISLTCIEPRQPYQPSSTPSSSPCSAKVILPPALRVCQQKSIGPRDRVTESRSIFTIPQAPSWICCAEHSPTSQQPSAERHRDTAQTPRCHGMPAPPLMPPSTRASL